MGKILIIARGLPGSGKTTFANSIGRAVCSADDYFMINGIYKWSGSLIGAAHMWCQRKCGRFMKIGVERIIVANTSTTTKELKPYYELAEKYGYRVFSVIVENRHNGINEHNVPEDSLLKMKERFNVKL